VGRPAALPRPSPPGFLISPSAEIARAPCICDDPIAEAALLRDPPHVSPRFFEHHDLTHRHGSLVWLRGNFAALPLTASGKLPEPLFSPLACSVRAAAWWALARFSRWRVCRVISVYPWLSWDISGIVIISFATFAGRPIFIFAIWNPNGRSIYQNFLHPAGRIDGDELAAWQAQRDVRHAGTSSAANEWAIGIMPDHRATVVQWVRYVRGQYHPAREVRRDLLLPRRAKAKAAGAKDFSHSAASRFCPHIRPSSL